MLIQADARQIPLQDGCVQCVVTSPPYFGLRDYGTARWVGGDGECLHRVPATGGTQNKGNNNREGAPFRAQCGVCGAERVDQQIGLEPTPDAYLQTLVEVFWEVRRVLKDDGVVFLNLGDSYANGCSGRREGASQDSSALARVGPNNQVFRQPAVNRPTPDGFKPKDLLGIPWMVAFALRADGWYLRSDIIWSKLNPMPESVTDRPTKSHEYLFLLSKRAEYFYDAAAIREPYADSTLLEARYGYRGTATKEYAAGGGQDPSETKRRVVESVRRRMGMVDAVTNGAGRNRRSVWTVPTLPYSGAHFATMPEQLVEPCILAGSRTGDLIFDPFMGSGTVGAVAERLGRRWVGTDLNPAYHQLAKKRTAQRGLRYDEATT